MRQPLAGDSAITSRPFRPLLKEAIMRSILLYMIGIPIPIILLLAVFTHHF